MSDKKQNFKAVSIQAKNHNDFLKAKKKVEALREKCIGVVFQGAETKALAEVKYDTDEAESLYLSITSKRNNSELTIDMDEFIELLPFLQEVVKQFG